MSWRIRAAWVAMLCCTVSVGALTDRAFTSADADTLFEAHTKAFYREKDGRAWFTKSTEGGKADIWMRAEQMEMVLDAYARTTKTQQIIMFTNLFRGLISGTRVRVGERPLDVRLDRKCQSDQPGADASSRRSGN